MRGKPKPWRITEHERREILEAVQQELVDEDEYVLQSALEILRSGRPLRVNMLSGEWEHLVKLHKEAE